MAERKLISIVTPCYNEEDNVVPCAEAVRELFETQLPQYDYEHIFCDNASTDSTAARLRELAANDRRVKVILNSRNFGPFRSNFNGVLATRGDAVLLFLPADLQDPPEVIPQLVAKWQEGYEVVYGVRKKREEGLIMRGARAVYYRLLNRLADLYLPPGAGEFQLVDRVVVDALRQFDDYYPYLRGMVASCGFRAVGVPYTWQARRRGKSKNRLYNLIDQGLNGMISFTNVPMRLCLMIGFMIAAASLLYAVVSLGVMLFYLIAYGHPIAPRGIPTLIVGVFFFSGVQLAFLGLLGEYICAIHSQVRRRPLVIERERINFDAPDASRPEAAEAPETRGAP
jgi:glycosyltransferase involved in cell wall biosynthesis